jgi:hypothetical protein
MTVMADLERLVSIVGRLEAQMEASRKEMKACREKMGPFKKRLNPGEKK